MFNLRFFTECKECWVIPTEVGSPDRRSTGSPSRPMPRSTTAYLSKVQASSGNPGGSGNGSRCVSRTSNDALQSTGSSEGASEASQGD